MSTLPHETQFGVMSRMQNGKTWWFDSQIDANAFAFELNKDGFEARHGVRLWIPEKHLSETEKQSDLYKRHGNYWR